MQSILERLLPLLKQAAEAHDDIEVTQYSRLDNELGLDSIGLFTVAFLLEEEFGIDVALHADAFAKITTVRDIVRFVEAAQAQQAENSISTHNGPR
jgi:acyl carrier protein